MDAMALAADTENLLRTLLIVSIVLTIPLGVLVMVLIFKVLFLLHSVSEFLTIIRQELTPVVQEVRVLAEGIGGIAANAQDGFKKAGESIGLAVPYLKKIARKLGHYGSELSERIQDKVFS